jgi:hypothetical protein
MMGEPVLNFQAAHLIKPIFLKMELIQVQEAFLGIIPLHLFKK